NYRESNQEIKARRKKIEVRRKVVEEYPELIFMEYENFYSERFVVDYEATPSQSIPGNKPTFMGEAPLPLRRRVTSKISFMVDLPELKSEVSSSEYDRKFD